MSEVNENDAYAGGTVEVETNTKITPAFDRPVNIMIDLETLGTEPGCVILSIGACVFLAGPEGQAHKFKQEISIVDSTGHGLVVYKDTLAWWNEPQQAVAKLEAFSGRASLKEVLTNFSNWLLSITDDPVVWGNAASFDLKILEAAYRVIGIPVPWNYRNEMCYRTLRTLFKGVISEPEFVGTKHNPLDDAIHQSKYCEMMYSVMAEGIRLLQKIEPGQTVQ